ncbi:MAG: FAD-binding protein [Candidatus Puniceispirillum sp.]|nr:FAD-binding protein [Candidatus Puniceispirillum sp.]MBL6775393.1 FAD-binding protein [Candidatus Puniceispirillum sp.]
MTFNQDSIDQAIGVLKQQFGDRLSVSRSVREQHGHTTTRMPNQPPDAVIFAENADEISSIMQTCHKLGCPVIAFGAGSSLEGHVNAPHGGISIDMSQLDQVLVVNNEDLDVVVQPGITREALNDFLRDSGLFFPIDPGANASIGGMAATGASGTNAVRYGTMRDNILGMQVVTADGRIVRVGGRARKSSAGYDLTRLFIGSEGTLGIITELTLRLQGIPEVIAGGICSFPNLHAACDAVIMTVQMGIPVARIELLDPLQVRACNAYSKLNLPEEPLLLVEFHGSAISVEDDVKRFAEICADLTHSPFQWSNEPEQRSKLWKARHDAYWAALALIPGAKAYATDVCVPISNLASCVEETIKDIKENGLTAPIVGHVGDGNFHVLPLAMPDDDAMNDKISAFAKRLTTRALAFGGTCTGEHGVGQGKRDSLREEMGDAVDLMAGIKASFDPVGILNPGKVFN